MDFKRILVLRAKKWLSGNVIALGPNEIKYLHDTGKKKTLEAVLDGN